MQVKRSLKHHLRVKAGIIANYFFYGRPQLFVFFGKQMAAVKQLIHTVTDSVSSVLYIIPLLSLCGDEK